MIVLNKYYRGDNLFDEKLASIDKNILDLVKEQLSAKAEVFLQCKKAQVEILQDIIIEENFEDDSLDN